MVPEPGDEDPGEKSAAKGNLMGYIIALFGTERMMRRSRTCRSDLRRGGRAEFGDMGKNRARRAGLMLFG
jgi:hypothetical protein